MRRREWLYVDSDNGGTYDNGSGPDVVNNRAGADHHLVADSS
jgi:hypothetical protein